MNLAGNKLTWLGHATFRIETTDGATVYVDPWVMNNPMCPDSEKDCEEGRRAHLHARPRDHIGDAVAIVKQHQPQDRRHLRALPVVAEERRQEDLSHEQGRHADGCRHQGHHGPRRALLRNSGGRWQHRLWRRGLRLRARAARRREALSRGRHRGLRRHADHSRAVRAGDRHAAHRRSLHHEPARSRLRLRTAEAERRHPHALRNISAADRPAFGIARSCWAPAAPRSSR